MSCFGQRFLLLERGRGEALGAEELTNLVSYNSPVLTAWWRCSRFCPFLLWLIQSDEEGERLVGHGENPGHKLYRVISCLKCPWQPPISQTQSRFLATAGKASPPQTHLRLSAAPLPTGLSCRVPSSEGLPLTGASSNGPCLVPPLQKPSCSFVTGL